MFFCEKIVISNQSMPIRFYDPSPTSPLHSSVEQIPFAFFYSKVFVSVIHHLIGLAHWLVLE